MKNDICIQVTGNELTLRTGEAEKIYPPRRILIEGDIKAPGEYFQKRWASEIESLANKTHVIVDAEELTMKLVVNEADEFATEITGQLTYFDSFLDFSINRKKNFTVEGLYKMLRLKRAYFKNREDHAGILDQLKKFEANTQTEFKSTNDFKGSTALQKIQTCKTNLSYNFILNIPIFNGLPAATFPVEIEFEPTDGSIVCWLISEDLAELEIKIRDEILQEQEKLFTDKRIVVIHK